MPYFKWKGIDLHGKDRHGKMFAHSQEHLDEVLLKRDIALITTRITTPLISMPINLSLKIQFFRRLATLLDAGVRLPQALSILSESIENASLQEIISNLEQNIQQGHALHNALSQYPRIFDPIMIHMINAGQEAGALPLSLNMLSTHLETKQNFYKNIRTAALLPVLTFLFFITVALVIMIAIMPFFASIFESMQQEMPVVTKKIMSVSSFLGSSRALIIGIGIGFVMLLGYLFLGRKRRRNIIDRYAIRIPGISRIVVFANIFSFFQSVATLIEGGMQLVPALCIAKQSVNNQFLSLQLDDIERAVSSGSSLSQALSQHSGPFSRPDIESMIAVGEESGCLAKMLNKVAMEYQERLNRQLSLYSTLFQPFLMIILGIFIALLIVAVYLPIMTISYSL